MGSKNGFLLLTSDILIYAAEVSLSQRLNSEQGDKRFCLRWACPTHSLVFYPVPETPNKFVVKGMCFYTGDGVGRTLLLTADTPADCNDWINKVE